MSVSSAKNNVSEQFLNCTSAQYRLYRKFNKYSKISTFNFDHSSQPVYIACSQLKLKGDMLVTSAEFSSGFCIDGG